MSRTMTCLAACCALILLAACESTEKAPATSQPDAAMGAINETCPLSGEPVDPDAQSVSYGEMKVGLCCDGCVKGWDEMTVADKEKFVSDAKSSMVSPGAMCGCGEVKGSPECCK